ncbi:SDR family oxidoreductase [Streptomyces cirratus]
MAAGGSALPRPRGTIGGTSRHRLRGSPTGRCGRADVAAPRLRDGGSITFSSGVLAIRPLSGTALTAGITGGIESLSRALAVELAPLRVNVIRPGVIRTELWDGSVPTRRLSSGAPGPSCSRRRVGTAEEAAAAHLFVLANAYVTGTTLAIDGGAALV